ncbi:MAG: GntR family transcriptional regulator, partial [Chloroflexota bacterium]
MRQAIWDALIAGELRPGDRITESKVARDLGVSQGPVREALRGLEQVGVVRYLPHRGTFVNGVSRADAAEIYSMRALLEGYAFRLAVSKVGPEEVHEFEEIIAAMHNSATASDLTRLIEKDVSFHRRIVELSGHGLLMRQWSTIDPLGWTAVTITRQFKSRPHELVEHHLPL